MGKKTTKRKTRWRTLSIGEVPSDTEEESHENHSTPNYYKNVKLRNFKPTSDNISTRSINNYSYRRNSGGSNNSSSYYYNHSTTHNGTSNTTNHHQYHNQREPSSYGAGAYNQRTSSSDYTTSSFHHNHRNGGSSTSTGGGVTASTSQSSHSTPIRSRYHRNNGYNGIGDKYKSSRSNSTASEPKITFNEDEYTRITTPRQDVLFKKGYLSKKKPLTAVSGDTSQNHHDSSNGLSANGGMGQQNHMNGHSGGTINNGGGGSCGESNPSTGYNSTTGGGTPEHHSLDGGDYYDTDIEQHQPPFIIHNGFVDHNGVFYVNGYDPFSMMLIGPPPPPPPGQFLHSVDFYPPPPSVSGVPCFPQITPSTIINNQIDSTTSNSSKRSSTDSQADESNSPHNENESSGETNNFASSEQSQSSSLDNNLDQQSSNKQTNNLTPTNTDSGVQTIEENNTSDDCIKLSNPDDGSSDSIEPITNISSTQSQNTTISSTSVPVEEEDIILTTKDGLIKTPPLSILPMQQSNNFVAPGIYPIPATSTHFFVAAGPHPTSFIPFPPPTAVPGQPIYINDINIQPSSTLNPGIVDPSKQRYIQKRRRRKLSKSQDDIHKKYSDNSESSTSDEYEPDENSIDNHSLSLAEAPKDITSSVEMNSVNDNISNETKDKQLVPQCASPLVINSNETQNETQKSSTIYKLDAEEFIPRSMRLQETSSTSIDEKSINPELRAKFENYLNRQSTNISDEQSSFMVGEFIPASDFIFHHPAELHHHYQLEQQLIGSSYPSTHTPSQASKHFIHHTQYLPQRRQFVNGYNKKRQKYIKPNHYYKSNYKNYTQDQQQQSTSTKITYDVENKVDGCKPESTVETNINTESMEPTTLPIENKFTNNDENVKTDLVVTNADSKDSDELKLEITASNNETNKSLETFDKPSDDKIITSKTNEIQKENKPPLTKTYDIQDEKVNKTETVEKSAMAVIDNKSNVPSNDIKEQQPKTPLSPIKIHKPLPKTENSSPTVFQVSNKNYAQILRKDDTVTTAIQKSTTIRKENLETSKSLPVSSKIQNHQIKIVQQPIRRPLKNSSQNVQKSTTNKIQIEPVHKPKVPTGNSLPEDNDWIAVPSRKKGKVKSCQQIAVSMPLPETYLTPQTIDKVEKVIKSKTEDIEPVVNTPKEIAKKEEILENTTLTETVVVPSKSVSPTVQIKNTKKLSINKLSHTPKNSVKKTKTNDSILKSDNQIEKTITTVENAISKQESVAPLQSSTPPDITKKQKGKSLKKQVIKENNSLTNQNTPIGESIDNLRKMSTEHSKTNIEISKEMDRLIQQGLYKNLGNTIKSLGNDKEFLSIIDPNINILPKMMFDPQLKMKGQNENLLELNIMETLNECQRYFANKNIKDVMFDNSSSTKDIKNQNVQDEGTNTNYGSVIVPSVTSSDDGNDQICDSVETNNKVSQISNISASIPSTSRVDEIQDEQVERQSTTTSNGVLITATSSSDKNIDEKTGKNVPIIIENNTNEADLSDNDDTLLSFKFDSNENISVITEEPRASVNNEDIEELELDENTSIKHSPDPDSWSSHTNLTTTSTEFTSNKLSTMSQQHKSLTEVVKEWLTEAQEKSPNVFKSPEKIYREKSAPPKLYNQYNNDSDSYDSEPEVGKSNEQEQEPSKNVKGNPLFVASANKNKKSLHHSFLSLIEPLITSNGYSVAASVSGAAIGEDALLANRRVAVDTNKMDFKTIAKRRIKENVAVFARELVNTVNPVVDGMNIETEDDEDKFKTNTNYCCEVNEHMDLNNEQGDMKNKLTTAGMQFTIKGAFVRDVGIIKRTVSENGAIFTNPTTSIVNNSFNSDVNSYVNKSKSCIDMKLLFVENEKLINSHSSVPSTREGSQEQQQYWEEDPSCWIHGDEDVGIESTTLLNNEKPLIKNGGTKICIKNNLTSCDEQNIYNKKELNNKKKDNKTELDDGEIIETYESMYGKNLDYLEIRQKVLNECEQKTSTSSSQHQPRVLNADPPCVLGQRGAVCCSIIFGQLCNLECMPSVNLKRYLNLKHMR